MKISTVFKKRNYSMFEISSTELFQLRVTFVQERNNIKSAVFSTSIELSKMFWSENIGGGISFKLVAHFK